MMTLSALLTCTFPNLHATDGGQRVVLTITIDSFIFFQATGSMEVEHLKTLTMVSSLFFSAKS